MSPNVKALVAVVVGAILTYLGTEASHAPAAECPECAPCLPVVAIEPAPADPIVIAPVLSPDAPVATE